MADKVTTRDQIIALQGAMATDMAQATKELVEYFAAENVAAMVKALDGFRQRMVPGSAMDQQLASFIGQFGQMSQISAQYYQQMVQQLLTKNA